MPDPLAPPLAAIVLPPKEGFGPGRVGGVGLLVHRLAGRLGNSVVVGAAHPGTIFPDVPFRPVPAVLPLPIGRNRIYAAGAARVVREIGPALVEVHNRPEVALLLARLCAPLPVVLFLHNDPQGMRGAGTRRARRVLVQAMSRVVAVSEYLRARLLDGVDPPPGRVPRVLPNCLDLAALPEAGQREPLILFAGRLVADKGADSFVAACARVLPGLPGWRAEMIGADRFSPESPETKFLRALRPAAEAAGIALPGYRPHAEVLGAMARAAIVVGAEPLGGAVRPDRARGDGLGGGADLLRARRAPGGRGRSGALRRSRTIRTRSPKRSPCSPGTRIAGESLGAAGRERARRFDLARAAGALAALRREVVGA